jgi:branched-chain amino acid transport system substrate-binding protein
MAGEARELLAPIKVWAYGCVQIRETSMRSSKSLNRRALLAGSAAAVVAMPTIVRAQEGQLKVGVLLPRSGAQAVIGRDCQRAVELAPPILKDLGLPDLAIMNADTESNVDTARARAEKLINDGAQLLVGAFDSGHTTAIAQVAEQKGIPLVINIAASPAITEQGYKFVFRNFPTAPMILNDAFANQKEVFAVAGAAPKTSSTCM